MNSSNKRELHRTRAFAKDLKRLPDAVKGQSWQAVQLLAEDPLHASLDVKKLLGYKMFGGSKSSKSIALYTPSMTDAFIFCE